MTHKPLKPGEEATDVALGADAVLGFVGHVETPWKTLAECPKRADPDGPESRVVLAAPWDRALAGVERFEWVELRPRVRVSGPADVERATRLHDKAHELCFISSSCNFPVRHRAEVRV